MTLSLVGRALKSSSYCPGFNLGGFNPRLTLKQAGKSWSYAKENIFLSSVGRALNWSSDGQGSNLGMFHPRLALKQAAKCLCHTEEIFFFICHLAHLLER
jgi:hypothetical protein